MDKGDAVNTAFQSRLCNLVKKGTPTQSWRARYFGANGRGPLSVPDRYRSLKLIAECNPISPRRHDRAADCAACRNREAAGIDQLVGNVLYP